MKCLYVYQMTPLIFFSVIIFTKCLSLVFYNFIHFVIWIILVRLHWERVEGSQSSKSQVPAAGRTWCLAGWSGPPSLLTNRYERSGAKIFHWKQKVCCLMCSLHKDKNNIRHVFRSVKRRIISLWWTSTVSFTVALELSHLAGCQLCFTVATTRLHRFSYIIFIIMFRLK